MVITVKGAPVQLLKFLCCHSIERGRIGIRESSVIETTSKPYVRKHVQGELLHSGTGGKRPNLRQSLLYSGGYTDPESGADEIGTN